MSMFDGMSDAQIAYAVRAIEEHYLSIGRDPMKCDVALCVLRDIESAPTAEATCTGPNCQGHPHSPECRAEYARSLQSTRSEAMSIVERAKDLAYRAHAGQVDKAGRPYIEHVERVAERVREDGRCPNEDCNGRGEIVHWDTSCGDPACCSPATSRCPDCDEAEAVAWLHDVVEDHPGFAHELIHSFPHEVSLAAFELDRHSCADGMYYACLRTSPLALRVKLADTADNSDEARLALLDDKTAARLRRKYAKAIKMLTGGDDV